MSGLFSVDASWLQSDSKIINGAKKSPHDQGTLWTITLPDGEDFGVVLEKPDANSVSAFCETVRSEWNERKEESEAKESRQAAVRGTTDHEREGNKEHGQAGSPAISVHQDSASFKEGLRQQFRGATEELNEATARVRELTFQVKALKAALNTWENDDGSNAPKDDREERTGVSVEVGKG